MKQIGKVSLEGRGSLTLHPHHYVTSGGEGEIYRVGNTVLKLYTDVAKMRRDNMTEKIALLARVAHEYIVAPQGIVRDPSGNPIGYFMPFVDGEPMSRVFTNDFRQRERFTDDGANMLVSRMRETVSIAHALGAIMVDANELNWLVSFVGAKGPIPRVIDVDSWAIGRFPGMVMMPSIRDWHTTTLTTLSDWFAWAIVTFQIYTGIHPYKGVLTGFERNDLENRMKANKSVFTSGIRLNRAVRDFSVIPSALCSWYEGVFQSGERSVPPSPYERGLNMPRAAQILRKVTTKTGSLVFEKILNYTAHPVTQVWPSGVVRYADGTLLHLATKRILAVGISSDVEIVTVPEGWLIARVVHGQLECRYLNTAFTESETLSFPVAAHGVFRSGNRLFAIGERGLTEVFFTHFGKPLLLAGNTWGVLPHATRWFDGVGVQDALGAIFLVIPFGDRACAIMRTPELDSLTVVFGVAGARYACVVVIDRKGSYSRVEFTFDREYRTYVTQVTDVDDPELNMTVLPKGVCASIVEDGKLTILVPASGKMVDVFDQQIATDMVLAHWDDRVLYIQNGALWSLGMQ